MHKLEIGILPHPKRCPRGGEQEKGVVLRRFKLNNNATNNFFSLSDAKQREGGRGDGFCRRGKSIL